MGITQQQDIKLKADSDVLLEPGDELGTAKPKNKQEEFLSQVISQLNELFITDHLTKLMLCIHPDIARSPWGTALQVRFMTTGTRNIAFLTPVFLKYAVC